jgi:hypothetical protein
LEVAKKFLHLTIVGGSASRIRADHKAYKQICDDALQIVSKVEPKLNLTQLEVKGPAAAEDLKDWSNDELSEYGSMLQEMSAALSQIVDTSLTEISQLSTDIAGVEESSCTIS